MGFEAHKKALLRNISMSLGVILSAATSACASDTGPDISSDISIVRFKGLIDGTGQPIEGREVAIEKGRIIAVGDHLSKQYTGATLLDKSTLYGLPGLVDAHVHITYAATRPHEGDAWQTLGGTPAPELLVGAVENACKTLQTGVTSVRDLFAGDLLSHHLRALINAGHVEGPRLFISGVGMHPSTVEGYSDGPDARKAGIEKLIEARVADGSDWLKIFATTGSASDLTGAPNFTDDELESAIATAKEKGLRVAVHSYSDAAVPAALHAGAHSLDHPVIVDDATLASWALGDTYYVPTVDHNRYYADYRAEYGYDAAIERDLRQFVQTNLKTVGRAHRAGVKIAFGSDAVLSMFGENTRELEWFIKAGMSIQETIKAATMNGAALMGKADELGQIKVGYLADLIGVEGNPLEDIEALTRRMRFVMVGGEPASARCGGQQ